MSTEPSTVAALPNANSSATALPVVSNTPAAPAKKAVRKVAKKATVKKASVKASVKAAATKKAVSKPVPKGAVKKAAQPKSKAVVQPAAEQKLKKPKLVRDSFTFPKDEYQAIAGLKQKALSLQHSAKKSEILRAGLMLLNGLNDKAFLAALAKVPALKTGRPAKS
jgi:hypothetical protein